MSKFKTKGDEIRALCKSHVLEFMQATSECQPGNKGMRQAQIFKNCGLSYGDYPKASASRQQYWIVAILMELKVEGKVERILDSGPWRLL